MERGEGFPLQNATSGEVWYYEYDNFNRLVLVKKSTVGTDGLKKVAEYTYDYRDLVVCRNADGKNEYFEYTPEGVLIYDGRPSPNSERDYVYANGSVWCELTGAGNVFYHHTDHLGTTEYMTDKDGTVVWQCEYEAFGKVIKKSGSKASSFKPMYTGKQLDESTGLYYFNARWYDPGQGRFISQDPARDGSNWWNYCRNNPLTNVDPSGLTTLDDFAYQKETSGDWSHKETSVYQQRAAEANREYSPVNIQQSTNLPGKEKKDFFVFQQDIDYLLSINPKYPYYQNSEELGFIDNFRLNACNFMSYLFDVQDYTGYNFSILEIASLVGYAQNKPNPVNKDEMCMLADFEVRNPDIIMNKAFEMTGHPELTATAGYNIGDLPCRTYTNITVKTGLGNVHRVVGDFEGNVIYNPWNGGTITEINTIMKVYIHGVMKK